MAQPTSRAEFKEWVLRKLGKPVIEINVDKDQLDDRVDEAISFWNDFHFDGTERTFLKHKVTANTKSDGYITVPDNIIGVINVFDIGSAATSTNSLFNLRYQFALNEIHNLAAGFLTNYVVAMTNIKLLEELLTGRQPLRYNRHTNQLHLDMDWDKVNTGQYLIAECYQVIDPDTYADMWKDRWLQNYATAKVKYQWGSNLTKFSGMQLPGGVQFNGEQILQDAQTEIEKLEEEMKTSGAILMDMVG